MQAETFRDKALGFWSSHPYWQRRKRVLFQVLALVPLVLVLAGIVLALVDFRNWLPMLQDAVGVLGKIGFGVAFVLAALMTLALNSMWASLQGEGKIAGGAGMERHFLHPAVTAVGVFLGMATPAVTYFLSRWMALPPRFRFAASAVALLPLVTVLVAMGAMKGRPSPGHVSRRRPVWFCLLLIVIALMVATVIYDLGETLGQTSASRLLEHWFPWYGRMRPRFVGLLVLAPVALVCYGLWELWRKVVPVPQEQGGAETPESETQPKKSLWKKLTDGLRRFLGLGEEEVVAPQRPTPPTWLKDLLKHLPEGCSVQGGPSRREPFETSEFSNRQDLVTVFGGRLPTRVQVEFFERFRTSYLEALSHGSEGMTGELDAPSADLMVEGRVGSGKSAALLACAVYAAFARGQRVLFLAPNDVQAAVVKVKFDAYLRQMLLEGHVGVGLLTESHAAEWLLGKESQLPHIVVATVDAAERCLYGGPYRQRDTLDRLRRLVGLMEVVLIDDLMEFEDAARAHLPFLVDKQRLLLSADGVPLQVVLTCPLLAEVARPLVGSRFFGQKQLRLDRNCFRFHPPPGGPTWRVDVSVDSVEGAIRLLAGHCLKAGLHVVLYRQGIDRPERARQVRALREMADSGKVAVVSDLEQAPGMPSESVDAVFYQVAVGQEDVSAALRLRMGHDQTVVFRLIPAGEAFQPESRGIVPILVSRTAEPFQVSHLESLLRFLRVRYPVHEDAWLQFGVRHRGLPEGTPADAPDTVFDYDDWREHGRYGADAWPYVSLRQHSSDFARVRVHGVPDASRRIYRYKGRLPFYIGRPSAERSAGGVPSDENQEAIRIAQWRDDSGQLLREVDLAHMRELKVAYAGTTYVPETIRARAEAIEIGVQRWQGSGDPYLPVMEVEFELPSGQTAQSHGGGRDYGAAWHVLEPPGGGLVPVTARITGLMSDDGDLTPRQAVEFGYRAVVSALLFEPAEVDPAEMASRIGEALSGSWKTEGGGRFLPALTTALTYALNLRLPGWGYFAKCLAFECAGGTDSVASSVAFIVEPWTTGGTVMPIVHRLLRDAAERKVLFGSARWFLGRLTGRARPEEFAHRFARVCYGKDDCTLRARETLALVDDVIAKADAQIGRVSAGPAMGGEADGATE